MEGKDCVFGDALNIIEENVRKQDMEEQKANEASKKKKKAGKANDPLKAGNPTVLKGEADYSKLSKMESKDKKEGIEPDEYKDDEKKKIEKLTEFIKITEEADLTSDVTALITKAKEALDKQEYDAARGFCDRLEQIQLAVSEPESSVVSPDNTGMDMPAIEPDEPMESKDKDKDKEDKKKKEEVEETSEEAQAFIMDDKLQEMIDRALDAGAGFNEAKEDPKAKARNRGDVIFPCESIKVKDNKDHFPINTEAQAKTALKRVKEYKSVPKWFDGDLKALVEKVTTATQKKYTNIDA